MNQPWLLVALGLGVGTLGTLVGAGGGFILMPVLFFLYPDRPPEQLTAISLAVVFFNALSGTIAYARAGRVDYRSGTVFALASAPGAILGSFATIYLSRNIFDPIFASLLIAAGIYLFLCPTRSAEDLARVTTYPTRILKERDGTAHNISYNLRLGIAISGGVGFLSSLLGIGGGIIHVPALVRALGFPIHIATATSHFILAAMTFTGSLVHLCNGSLAIGAKQIVLLAPGVIVGAQIGAPLSKRIQGNSIIRVLALALAFVGVRLLLK